MSHRGIASTGMLTMLIVVVASAQGQTAATATSTSPRTPWGQPDLQGVWDFGTITPLERPAELAGKQFLTEEEAANLERAAADRDARLLHQAGQRTEAGGDVGNYNNFWMDRGTRVIGTRRTSLIVHPPDGKIPPLTPEGQRRADARQEYREAHPADSWEDRSVAERCMLGFNTGPPMEPRSYNNNLQMFQTPDYLVILNEMVHDARVIPLEQGAHLPAGVRQWMGDSRARWEGDTLVIDTTNFYNKTSFSERHGATPNMRLVERLSRVDADTLVYEFTVEDPATWTSPWTVEVQMASSEDRLYGYACHEGNHGMAGILAGYRTEEREAARGSR